MAPVDVNECDELKFDWPVREENGQEWLLERLSGQLSDQLFGHPFGQPFGQPSSRLLRGNASIVGDPRLLDDAAPERVLAQNLLGEFFLR